MMQWCSPSVLTVLMCTSTSRPWKRNIFVVATRLQVDEDFLRYDELSQANPLWLNGATTVTLGDVVLSMKQGQSLNRFCSQLSKTWGLIMS